MGSSNARPTRLTGEPRCCLSPPMVSYWCQNVTPIVCSGCLISLPAFQLLNASDF